MMDRCILVLRNIFGSDIKEEDVNIEGQSNKGDGYINDVLFINVEHDGKKLSLVAKTIPEIKSESMRNVIRTLYESEVIFYESIWPALDLFQRKNSKERTFDKIPKFFGSSPSAFVLENLKELNFSMRPKNHMYDRKLVELLFHTYGHFHAISLAIKHNDREEFDRLGETLKNGWNTFIKWDIIQDALSRFAPILPKVCTDAAAREKVEIFANNITDIFDDVTVYKGNYHTLVHGDCWINNFLFKLDDSGEIEDLRLLDFQLVQMATPVYDLSYCFYSGATKDLLEELDHFLQVYYTSLTNSLREFGCDVNVLYPFEALMEEWKQYSKFGFIIGLMVWRGKCSESVIDLKDVDLSDGSFEHMNCDEEMYGRVIGDLIDHVVKNQFI